MPPAAPLATSAPGWAARLAALRPGERLTLVGLDAAALAAGRPPGAPPLLRLDLAGVTSAEGAVARILDDLAALALAAWPDWPASPLVPTSSPTPWRRAAERLAAAGRPPRFLRVPPATQMRALHPAAGAPALVFALEADATHAAPLIAAQEWACRHGAATIVLLPTMPAPEAPWDRVLHGAIAVEPPPPTPASTRLVPPPVKGPLGSAIERRMRAALAAHADLAGLFMDEVTLRLGLGVTPRVDLLWADGKVVVELDGTEHERDQTYRADRHRDYELMLAGYLVLRLTNEEVELDLARSLDKIGRIVDLRRPRA